MTGAGQGVGAETAARLAGRGARVAVNDIAGDRSEQVVDRITAAGGIAVSVVADVRDPDAIAEATGRVEHELGPIDILVNNAGVPPTGFRLSPFVQTSPDEWDAYIGLSLYGVMHCTKAVLAGMIERKWGRIIAITSDAGRYGEAGMTAYSAAKAGAAGFMRALAKEVGPDGITCNCLSLGSIEPPPELRSERDERRALRYPMRRLGRPEDVAGAVVWLSVEESEWITGQTISVNGGYVTA
ncbi:SDR family NAD(P)-dependent oxidoreductase [Cryptosporangium sp. NPDC051539]|uniref:SDR family NAD(P)-dependent oxidoreductase n=1 Tax=Cryptosporangium sp. NPDC051539 TaxID=3363962 RepID=UPI0037B088AB